MTDPAPRLFQMRELAPALNEALTETLTDAYESGAPRSFARFLDSYAKIEEAPARPVAARSGSKGSNPPGSVP
jgi:hypothetical protein